MTQFIKNLFTKKKRQVSKEELKKMILLREDISKVDYSHIEDMEYLFAMQYDLKEFPPIDFTNVKNTGYMFYGCKNLEEIPELHLPQTTDASFMFESCENVKKVGDLTMPKVVRLESMFDGCARLRTVGSIYSPKAKNMTSMFSNCNVLISIGPMDTSSAETMDWMFRNSYSFPVQELPWDFSNVKSINNFADTETKIIKMIGTQNLIKLLKRNNTIDDFKFHAIASTSTKKSFPILFKIVEKEILCLP